MPFTPQQLYTEITTDPSNIGYAASWAAGDDAVTAALLNATTGGLTLLQPISMVTFAKIVTLNGVRQKVTNGLTNATYGAMCQTALDMLAQLSIPFDPTDSLTQQIMGALVSPAGILAASDVTAIETACTLPASRAQVLWGYQTVIQPSDVGAARRAA